MEKVTFSIALQQILDETSITLEEKSSYISDLVYQAVEQHIMRNQMDIDPTLVIGVSLGSKLKLLKGEDNPELKKKIKKYRGLRLACRKRKTLSVSHINELQKSAMDIVEHIHFSDVHFTSRIPIRNTMVNSVSVETLEGYRYFQILHADVFRVPSDLTIVSTHANPDEVPSGILVEQLQKKGIQINPDNVFQIINKDRTWTCFQEVQDKDNISAVLTIRMKKSDHLDNPALFFSDAVRGMFASIAALEYLGHRFQTINLPVIYGGRIVDYTSSIEALLTNALQWLKKSDYTERINFVVYSTTELVHWNNALDSLMGRSLVSSGSDKVLDGLLKELAYHLSLEKTGILKGAIEPIQFALSNLDQVCIQNICVFGRKLVEQMTLFFIQKYSLKKSGALASNIETLRSSKKLAPWICSYMHSLRIFGNETVHPRNRVQYLPKGLDANDLISALSAMKALILFWNNWQEEV